MKLTINCTVPTTTSVYRQVAVSIAKKHMSATTGSALIDNLPSFINIARYVIFLYSLQRILLYSAYIVAFNLN
jgi:hypothetical protein